MRYSDLTEREQWALAQELSNRYTLRAQTHGPISSEDQIQMSKDLLKEKGIEDG